MFTTSHPMKSRNLFVFLIFCCLQIFWSGMAWGQSCGPCTVTITSSNQTVPNNLNSSAVICFKATNGSYTYSTAFNMDGSTICVEPGATLKQNSGNWNNKWLLNNSGDVEISSQTIDGTIISSGNLNFTANNVTLKSSLNNTGNTTFTGSVLMDASSGFSSNGNLVINGSVSSNSNSITTIVGSSLIRGNLQNLDGTINLAGNLTVNGNTHLNGNGKIQAINGNQCNSVKVVGNFSTDANNGITGNNFDYAGTGSALFVNKMPVGNANTKLTGGAKVGSCPLVDCLTTQKITTSTGIDVIYIYKCSGTFILPQLIEGEELTTASIVVVAGGGGGGYGEAAGGGGAGAINYNTAVTLTPGQPYDVVVGLGGAGASSTLIQGGNGAISGFNGMIALGGGGGGSAAILNGIGRTGGSGGGGAYSSTGNNGVGGQSYGTYVNTGGKADHSGGGNQTSGGGGGGSSGSGVNGSGNSGGNGANGSFANAGNIQILADLPSNFLSANNVSEVFAAGGGGNGANPGNGNGGGIPSGGGGGSSIGGNGIRGGKGLEGKKNTGSGGGAGSIGGGSGGHGIVVIRVTYRILPVEFLSFTANYQPRDRFALLNWSTAKEWENSHFEIERAVNTVKKWETIGRVEGNGYSDMPAEYSYLDIDLPTSGGNIFYRLKQVDYSGKFSYSNTKAIQVDAIEGVMAWAVYPNPSSSGQAIQADLKTADYQDEIIYVQLSNVIGQTRVATLSNSAQLSALLSDWLQANPMGLYVLDISWGDHSQQIKLLRH